MPNLGPIEWLFLGGLLAIAAGLLVVRGFRIREDNVKEWATASGLRLTSHNQPLVSSYLTWRRRARVAGAVAGYLLPTVYSVATDEPVPVNGVVLVLAGYLIGAVAAEMGFNGIGGTSGSAVLAPRRLVDYLPGYVQIVQRGLAAASLLLVGAYAVGPFPTDKSLTVAQFALLGLAGVAILGTVEVLQRLVVARRQAVSGTDMLEADDAIRVSSVQVIAGAGIALLLIVVGTEFAAMAVVGGVAGFIFAILGLFLNFSALFWWLDLRKPHGHRVARGSGRGVEA